MQQRLDIESREKPPGTFAVVGTGSLGGHELGYGDEVDLLYVYDTQGADAAGAPEFFVEVGRDLTAALRDETGDGSLYNVVPPPWPQIDGGLKACSLAEYSEHFSAAGSFAERLTLTRARPIAGDADLGARFMTSSQPFVYRDEPDRVSTSSHGGEGRAGHEIELLTQSIQLVHGARHAALRQTGTLGALEAMGKAGLIDESIRRELDHAYVFLRTAEHRLQLGLGDVDLAAQVERSRARVREICATIGRSADA